MQRDVEYYTSLPWSVRIDPELQDDGEQMYVASLPEFDGILGTGVNPEEALADLKAALRSAVEAMLAEGFAIPAPVMA